MSSHPLPPTFPGTEPLPGMPRGPLTPAQQLEALRRVKAQAEQRVKLGLQLFKAAEAHTSQYQSLLSEIRRQQEEARTQMQEEVARSLHTYDQWVGRVQGQVQDSLERMDQRIDELARQWDQAQGRINQLIDRADAMFTSGRAILDSLPAMMDQFTQSAKAHPGLPGPPGLPGAPDKPVALAVSAASQPAADEAPLTAPPVVDELVAHVPSIAAPDALAQQESRPTLTPEQEAEHARICAQAELAAALSEVDNVVPPIESIDQTLVLPDPLAGRVPPPDGDEDAAQPPPTQIYIGLIERLRQNRAG